MIVQPILFLGVILGFLLPWAELGGEPVRGFAFAELVFGQLTGTGLQP